MEKFEFVKQLRSNIKYSNQERVNIIRKSCNKDSWQTKCVVAMEELSELSQQLSKQYRCSGSIYSLIEEMADVYIVLTTIAMIFNLDDELIERAIDVKLYRECKRNQS